MKLKVLRRTDKCIGRILIELHAIDENRLNMALRIHKIEKSSTSLGSILVKLDFVSEVDILRAFLIQYSFPYLPADGYNIDKRVINLIPEEFSRKHTLVPLERIGNTLTVAMSNPLNIAALTEVKKMSQCNVQVVISLSAEIHRAINRYYNNLEPLEPPLTGSCQVSALN